VHPLRLAPRQPQERQPVAGRRLRGSLKG
jgi:hypothetical protein